MFWPDAAKSSARPPAARPSVNRPPDSWSSVAASLASNTKLRVGATRMSVSNPMREVAAAAAANTVISS